MINLKSLALATTLTLGTLVGGTAQAAPAKCFIFEGGNTATGTFVPCDHSERTNSNGHQVSDYALFNNGETLKFSVVWWSENGIPTYVETFGSNGFRNTAPSYQAKNGAWCFNMDNGMTFCH